MTTKEQAQAALEALRKCWKPRGGMMHLDMELAWNFVGDFEEAIIAALEAMVGDDDENL